MVTILHADRAHATETIESLRAREGSIRAQLDGLASFSLQTGVGPIGFRSESYLEADHTEWVGVDLGREQEIDLIVLVPVLRHGSHDTYEADAFPLEFHLLAGSGEDAEGTVIASFGPEDGVLPRIAPLVIQCPGTRASWVRLVATRLGQRAWDGQYCLELAEMMVFRGKENLALGCPVIFSSLQGHDLGARQRQFLVDGSLPYLMHAPGKKSTAYFVRLEDDAVASFTTDLGELVPVNGLHLHGIDVSDTVPSAVRANFAFPRHLILEGAQQPDFSDARVLCDYVQRSMYDFSPIVRRRFPAVPCRYLRFSVPEADPPNPAEMGAEVAMLGFAEIEVLSHGRNVLAGRVLKPHFKAIAVHNTPQQMTDGVNIYGRILHTRDWIEQLALRHDLELELPQVQARLDELYIKQEKQFIMLRNLSILMLGLLVIVILLSQIIRSRQLAAVRQRLAADLHDQVGANLHAIGLLSDIARDEVLRQAGVGKHEELLRYVGEIRDTTERTAASVRHCSDTLEPHIPLVDLEEDMHRIAQRMMEGYDYAIRVEGKEQVKHLKPMRRAGLFLFYKECLVNISRHAQANRFEASVRANRRHLIMTVIDNGRGMESTDVPVSLQRRAKMLRGKLHIESPVGDTGHGTRVTLTIPVKTLWPFF